MATVIGQNALLERARELGFPSVSSSTASYLKPVLEGEASWRERTASASEAESVSLSHELAQIEARRAADRDRSEREAILAAPPDPEIVQRAEAEARADLARYERERPQRVEQLLERICASIEGLARSR